MWIKTNKRNPMQVSRRQVVLGSLGTLGSAALGSQLLGCAGLPIATKPESVTVPHSAGTDTPVFAMPALACDCHHHIYDRRYPAHPSATLLPEDASIADYKLLQKRLGLQRNVIVQPSTYGVDNRLLVDTLKVMGSGARGVAVVDVNVSDDQLLTLHQAGVRGIRFNLSFLVGITTDMMLPLSKRIAPMGWHIQINGSADRILAQQALISSLEVPVVFDHMGQLPQPQGTDHPVFKVYERWLGEGKTWFKLSGPYLTSKKADMSDAAVVAHALIAKSPDRMVWGSDWPHPTKKANEKPNDATILNLLAAWAPTEAARAKILVHNPAKLYGF